MEKHPVEEALAFLNETYDQSSQGPDYMGSGEDLLKSLEWKIRLQKGELFEAVKKALGYWLDGDDSMKAGCALVLIGRLHATEFIPRIERFRDDLRRNTSRWPSLGWLTTVESVLSRLHEAGPPRETGGPRSMG